MERRIKKIVLIEPKPPGYHVYSRVALPRLGLPLLGAIAQKSLGYQDVTIYCEDIAPIDMADVLSADVVGVSTTTSTAPSAYRICDEVRKHGKKGAITMLGGVHVTFMPEEAAEHADFVIKGEAETCFVQLMNAIENRVENELPQISERSCASTSERRSITRRRFRKSTSFRFRSST